MTTSEQKGQALPGADAKFASRRQPWWRLLLPPVAVLIVIGGSMLLVNPKRHTASLDGDLCPSDAEAISGSIAFLFDFTKPLDKAQANLPSELLDDVSFLMGRNQELRLFMLSGSQSAPRTLLKRVCKPYASQDLQIGAAKDGSGVQRDCYDLPAQLPVEIRDGARAFCAQREALKSQLDALAVQDWPDERQVEGAYLVEALEDIRLDFVERPEPHLIYLFSDMMQHAQWYSHVDQDWSNWRYDEFADHMSSQYWAPPDQSSAAGSQVEIFYIPRRSWTDQPRVREVHWRFWREYFAGAEVVFHNQSPAPPYPAVQLMDVLTEAEIAARERQVVEQMLQEVREEQRLQDDAQREFEKQQEDARRILLEQQQRLEQERERLRIAEVESRTAESANGEGDAASQPEADQRLQAAGDAGSAQLLAARLEQPAAPAEEQLGLQQESIEAPPSVAAIEPLQDEPEIEQAPIESLPAEDRSEENDADLTVVVDAVRRCNLVMSPSVVDRSPAYPRGGRMNFGKAVIVVDYQVDEAGETVDDAIEVVRSRSQADRDRYFDLFAAEAVATVGAWSFDFAESPESNCVRRQSRMASFEFDYSYR